MFTARLTIVRETDVTNPADVQRLSAAAASKFCDVDVWIDFAGIEAIGRFFGRFRSKTMRG